MGNVSKMGTSFRINTFKILGNREMTVHASLETLNRETL